jgi:hypothetical protein
MATVEGRATKVVPLRGSAKLDMQANPPGLPASRLAVSCYKRLGVSPNAKGARAMPDHVYSDYSGKTLAAIFQIRRDAGDSVDAALAYLTSALSPPVETTPALPDGWRLIEYANTVGVFLPDRPVVPGTEVTVVTDSAGFYPASLRIDGVELSEILTALKSPAVPTHAPDQGGKPETYNWQQLFIRLECFKPKIEFYTYEDLKEYLRNNASRIDGEPSEGLPDPRTVTAAIKRYGFSKFIKS